MKCVRKTKTDSKLGFVVKRVSNERAAELVKEGWAYCPKSVWKKVTRNKPKLIKKHKKNKKDPTNIFEAKDE